MYLKGIGIRSILKELENLNGDFQIFGKVDSDKTCAKPSCLPQIRSNRASSLFTSIALILQFFIYELYSPKSEKSYKMS